MPPSFSSTQTAAEASKRSHAATLLSPSGISLFLCLTLGAAVPLWTALLTRYKSSALQQQLTHWQHVGGNGGAYTGTLTSTSNNIVGSTSNSLFWLIMLVVSIVAGISIVKAIMAVYAVERELHYINQDHKAIVREAMIRLGASLLAVGSILGITFLLFKRITVWSIEQSSSLVQHMSLTNASLRLLAIALVLAGLLHVYVVLMRLALLRTRIMPKL